MTDQQTCDASTIVTFADIAFAGAPRTMGPCILRHGHDGPVHREAGGATWASLQPDAEVQQLRAEVERLHAAQMSTLGELAKARGRRRRYRQAWQSARRRAADAEAEVARQHADCQAAEAAVARVRRFGELYATSCHVVRAETARDLLAVLDGQEAGGV